VQVGRLWDALTNDFLRRVSKHSGWHSTAGGMAMNRG
jgi:hypothetical protein